jgi:APA family basic amino acid/polyamine antiporter
MSQNSHKIGAIRLTALVTGNLVGASVFLLPATLAAFGSLSLLGWIITSFGAIILALIFASLSQNYSGNGGPYLYAKKAFGYDVGFYVCWGYWMMSWISNSALLAGALGYLTTVVGHIDKDTVIIAEISIIMAIMAFNLLGIEVTGSGELIVTVLKLIPLLIIPIFGLGMMNYENFNVFNASQLSVPSALNAVALATLFSFIGLETGTVPGGQVLNPKKNIPIATISGTLIAAIIYILGTVAIFGLITPAELVASKAPYADAANMIFGGTNWGYLFALAVIISCVGALNGWTMIVGRIPQAAVKDGMFPEVFGKVNRFGTPYMGVIISSLLSIPFILMSVQDNLKDQFIFVTDIAVTLVLVIYLICVLAYLKLLSPSQSNYWGKLILGLAGLLFVLWALWAANLKMVALSMVIFLLGLPVHLWMKYKK